MVTALPRESVGDKVHLVARMGLSAFPVIGGPALELLNQLIAPPIQRRRDKFLEELYERLVKLEQQDRLKIEDLRNNEEFISTALQALTVALRNHQHEKIEALRNAIINVAVGQSPEDTKRELFLRLVDNFSVVHLRQLKAFRNHDLSMQPDADIKTSMMEIAERAQKLLPELREQYGVVEVVVDDLCRNNLLFWNRSGGVTYIQSGMTQVTELGDEFLRFIADPAGSFPSR